MSGKIGMGYKLTVKYKGNPTVGIIKKILKSNVKIGIRTFKKLKDSKVLIEADTKNDIEILNSQIRDKCVDRLESNVQKRRNPRLITYDVPDEVTLENAEDIIRVQNSALALNKGDITKNSSLKRRGKKGTW